MKLIIREDHLDTAIVEVDRGGAMSCSCVVTQGAKELFKDRDFRVSSAGGLIFLSEHAGGPSTETYVATATERLMRWFDFGQYDKVRAMLPFETEINLL